MICLGTSPSSPLMFPPSPPGSEYSSTSYTHHVIIQTEIYIYIIKYKNEFIVISTLVWICFWFLKKILLLYIYRKITFITRVVSLRKLQIYPNQKITFITTVVSLRKLQIYPYQKITFITTVVSLRKLQIYPYQKITFITRVVSLRKLQIYSYQKMFFPLSF